MKRSRIFLFLTTGCLAVAGLFAAKANHFTKTIGYYVTDKGRCIPSQACLKNTSSTVTCVESNSNFVFTKSDCTSPLHYTAL